jgi:hypothetical protein
MEDKQTYIPMNKLMFSDIPTTGWTFTKVNLSTSEVSKKGVVPWCKKNIHGKWTMLSSNKFGFESGEDATVFRLYFG